MNMICAWKCNFCSLIGCLLTYKSVCIVARKHHRMKLMDSWNLTLLFLYLANSRFEKHLRVRTGLLGAL